MDFGLNGKTAIVAGRARGITRAERTAGLMMARAEPAGVTLAEAEAQDFAVDGPRSNALGRMSEVADVAVFLASNQGCALTGELLNPNSGAGNAVYY